MPNESANAKTYGPLVLWARWVKAGILTRLTPSARNVAMVLASYANKKTGEAFPAASTTIPSLTGHSKTTVFGALAKLKKEGVIRPVGTKRRQSNATGPVVYQFCPPPAPMSLCRRDTSAKDTQRVMRLRRRVPDDF
jgi:hypothetical protein